MGNREDEKEDQDVLRLEKIQDAGEKQQRWRPSGGVIVLSGKCLSRSS